jgi:hypothetical protein
MSELSIKLLTGREAGIPTSTASITKTVKLAILAGVPVALKIYLEKKKKKKH